MGSNHDKKINSFLCYRYTKEQNGANGEVQTRKGYYSIPDYKSGPLSIPVTLANFPVVGFAPTISWL